MLAKGPGPDIELFDTDDIFLVSTAWVLESSSKFATQIPTRKRHWSGRWVLNRNLVEIAAADRS